MDDIKILTTAEMQVKESDSAGYRSAKEYYSLKLKEIKKRHLDINSN